jgi:septum formation protein
MVILTQRPNLRRRGAQTCVTIKNCMMLTDLILASNSPRRRQMLAWTGWQFAVSAAEIDETPLPGEAPGTYVARLARSKGLAHVQTVSPGTWVLAADTIVADGDFLLGKPAGPAEARAMLNRLRGRTHQVFTALTIIEAGSGRSASDLCQADVPMRAYSDAEMDAYIDSGDPLDKAGAYAIQHAGFHPVENFHGCFACVMGLPLCHLTRTLGKLGFTPPNDVPSTCQAQLEYACPVFPAILLGEAAAQVGGSVGFV